MIKYLSCKRNGRQSQQTLDSRACLACACQLNVRKKCPSFVGLSNEQVQQDVVWLQAKGYTPHNFTIRLKKLDIVEGTEVVNEPMQVMRQHNDTKRNESTPVKKKAGIRGAMLTL